MSIAINSVATVALSWVAGIALLAWAIGIMRGEPAGLKALPPGDGAEHAGLNAPSRHRDAPAATTDRPGRLTVSEDADLEQLSYAEVYRLAQIAGIRGRSRMRRDELIEALKAQIAPGAPRRPPAPTTPPIS